MYRPQQLPESLGAVLDEVRSWESSPIPHTAQERADLLAGLRQLADATEAVFTKTLARFDANGDGETLHAAANTTSWLRGALHLAPADASRRVSVARHMGQHLSTAIGELVAGRVTFDQVQAIDKAVSQVPEEARDSAVELLTDLATRVDAAQVRVAGRHLRNTLDPDGALAEANKQFERRYLHLSPLLDGMTAVDGLLDPEAATTLSTALAPFLMPAGSTDDRTAAQRRADGLVEVAQAAMDTGELPQLSGAPAQVQVLVPYATLAADGTDPAQLPEAPGGTAFLTPPSVDRLICDGQIGRVILNGDSVPIDMGRYQRLFTPQQRRALAIRDGGCRFPDCNRPPRYTDAHHIVAWTDDGPTDLSNGILLCRYHHRVIHDNNEWRIRCLDPDFGANGPLVFDGPQQKSLPSTPRGP